MTDAPERIWLDWRPGLAVTSGPLASKPRTEYVRADTVSAIVIDCFQEYVDANEARIDAEAKLAAERERCSEVVQIFFKNLAFDEEWHMHELIATILEGGK